MNSSTWRRFPKQLTFCYWKTMAFDLKDLVLIFPGTGCLQKNKNIFMQTCLTGSFLWNPCFLFFLSLGFHFLAAATWQQSHQFAGVTTFPPTLCARYWWALNKLLVTFLSCVSTLDVACTHTFPPVEDNGGVLFAFFCISQWFLDANSPLSQQTSTHTQLRLYMAFGFNDFLNPLQWFLKEYEEVGVGGILTKTKIDEKLWSLLV